MRPLTVIVTGANRGIGKAICRQILAGTRDRHRPLKLYATSRTGQDLGYRNSIPEGGDRAEVLYPKLDIANAADVRAFADEVRSAGTPIHALINNAGVNLDAQYGYENARTTLDVNYGGTLEMCKGFIPLLAHGTGRIVNLSSVASSLKPYSATIQARFRDPDATLEDLDRLAEDYLHSVQTGTEQETGFFAAGRSYNVSKALVNSLTYILARDHARTADDGRLIINACCPGWIRTDMGSLVGSGKTRPPKTADEGAKIPVRLALGEIGGVTGRYWANSSVRSSGEGEVQEW